ncbi:helix-turn-helix transcriptional regulator [Roseibium sp.]|uniref:helix-turn-helix transcriptional regulator n=1 Tax=Roseibium sp. TaxID=1936156 RepID=UPI00391BF782
MRLLTLREVTSLTTLRKDMIRQLARDGKFPSPIKLGERRIAFSSSEVDAWIKRMTEEGPRVYEAQQ